jgi:glyoxylase-like metal-dependent hydrolase (beta-lactamase superfamily II)
MGHVQAAKVADGLWRWTGWHEEWRQEVGSVYAESGDGICLIDPLVPPEDPVHFWRALDRDVTRVGGPVHVLVTVYWHTRHAAAMVERYGARVWAASRGRSAVARRAGTVTDPFRPGDRLPGGLVAYRTARANEVVYHLPEHRALVAGDVVLGATEGGLRLCPEGWLPSGTGHAELRASLLPLLELDLERVLVSHGEPVLEGGSTALASLLRG